MPKTKEEQRQYAQEHYRLNRDRYIAKTQRWKAKQVEWFEEYKSTLRCARCPENHPACLDFHHRDPSEKDVEISDYVKKWCRERLLEEIAKCDVLCANCHRKHHWDERRKRLMWEDPTEDELDLPVVLPTEAGG